MRVEDQRGLFTRIPAPQPQLAEATKIGAWPIVAHQTSVICLIMAIRGGPIWTCRGGMRQEKVVSNLVTKSIRGIFPENESAAVYTASRQIGSHPV